MKPISGNHIYLRSLEAEDIDFLFRIENDERFWILSDTVVPFSRESLINYISNAQQPLQEVGQYRYVICNDNDQPVGLIDLFEYDATLHKAGIGLIIAPDQQKKGYGSSALACLISYAFDRLKIKMLVANVLINNTVSISLFEKFNFEKIGVKKKHILSENGYIDQILFQLKAD